MDIRAVFEDLGLTGSAVAVPIASGHGVGLAENDLVTPASVMKVQVALAAEDAMVTGKIDGAQQRVLLPHARTPGPVGISLMRDEVRMSTRDLVSQMLTISDNVATDELIGLVGLDAINSMTVGIGLSHTLIASDLITMLDELAVEVGFADYATLAAHDPSVPGPPSTAELRDRLASAAALDPTRGSRTTAAETVRLLQAIWTDGVAHPDACASVRHAMRHQLTRNRIASGFGGEVATAAKSGGLMGIVRNEAGVVAFPDGQAYAVAVFTRRAPDVTTDPAAIDAGIGRIARILVDELRS